MAVQTGSTTCNIQMPGLFRLPLELRNQIYRYLIPVKHIIEASNPCFKYTVSYKDTIEAGIEGSDIEQDISDSTESRGKQGAQIISDIEVWDSNPSVCEKEDNDSESDLLGDTHMKGVVDFGGCSNSVYEIFWEDVSTSWGTDRKKNSIFLVCKQISNEALNIMYGENAFRHYLHGDGGLCFKRKFTEANRRRMRFLLLEVKHRRRIGKIIPDITMWSSFIPTLNILRLVAEQPVQQTYWNAPLLEKEMERWIGFLRAFLKCFHQLLEGKVLEVDFDGKSETAGVVKECMLGGYREVRCRLSGDLIFRRGRFSYESGYWDDNDHSFGSWDA